MSTSLIAMNHIVKSFNGTYALKGVDFDVRPGEIHALLGENGAGKSTLIKILTGAYRPDEGEILVGQKSHSFIPVTELGQLGISVVYQDLKLAPGVSVMENILMGSLPRKYGMIDYKKAKERTREALNKAGIDLDPMTSLGSLKIADQEIVAIAKALSKDAKVLILDEPTALLGEDDVKRLFEILRDLVAKGVSIIYISHKLEEIFEICDRATVLRDGNKIWTKPINQLSNDELIEAISGKVHTNDDVYYPAEIKGEALKVNRLSNQPYYEDITFHVNRGEVVGLFGLVGAGKSEMLKGIFGEMKSLRGEVYLNGSSFKPKSPRDSIRKGIGFVPEDRSTEGYLPRMPIYINANISTYRNFSRMGFTFPKEEKAHALALLEGFNVKYSSLDQHIDGLSGGNQQKVVVAKWIDQTTDVLLLDEPTAGIDVGARRDIFQISRKLADEGKSVLYCSSYLPEIMEVADRILVMGSGRITGEFSRDEFDDMEIMRAAYK
ncbi:sugar ABC transporter ATP-binding protein [Rossellomorea vietnamensis]|uniref:sugar ABC transporter ATP-binding protein n=1 Tax=Rossellomorea vietnamensis TaxID=218284 RepID=UPI001E5B4C44|nr:sugar ABC transporter ATP-binding protein [Rossellomorea vietnamensis]MCC5801770.1 sugar ABC transporter ATP-binding protein [Rossellomorea vietnamensis]